MATTTEVRSRLWTGREEDGVVERRADMDRLRAAIKIQRDHANAMSPSTPYVPPKLETPAPVYVPIKYEPVGASLAGHDIKDLEAYERVATEVGVSSVGITIEKFKAYLRQQVYPTYDLLTVVSFMDDKARAEGNGWGWKWLPLRDQDRLNAWWGTPSSQNSFGDLREPASDYYTFDNRAGTKVGLYPKTVPLHALEKVAKIEREFGKGEVAFMVTDYETAPAFRPDPFLLAVINNGDLARGTGRFVIDVWDEPGFGFDMQLKAGV